MRHLKIHSTFQCRIQHLFWGAGFSLSVARRKTVVQLGSLVGRCKPSPVGSRSKAPENFWLFCIPNSSRYRFHGSAITNGDNLGFFRLINFYTFESLGVRVWDPKPLNLRQNASGYGTAFCKLTKFTNRTTEKRSFKGNIYESKTKSYRNS